MSMPATTTTLARRLGAAIEAERAAAKKESKASGSWASFRYDEPEWDVAKEAWKVAYFELVAAMKATDELVEIRR